MTRQLVAAAIVLALGLAGCATSDSLLGSTDIGGGQLGPLSVDKVPLVRTTAEDAASTVLAHELDTGWPDEDIAWQDGGCVRVGWYEPRPMSFSPDPGPPYPVYVVRLVDAAAPARTTWVMVDARTGAIDAAFGAQLDAGCGEPDAGD